MTKNITTLNVVIDNILSYPISMEIFKISLKNSKGKYCTEDEIKKLIQAFKEEIDTNRFLKFQLEWQDDYCLTEDIDQDKLKRFFKLNGLEKKIIEHTLEKRQDVSDEEENNEDYEEESEDDKLEKENDNFEYYEDDCE